MSFSWRHQLLVLLLVFPFVCNVAVATATPFKKLKTPPLTERWFGIFVDNERVGFYHQKIGETAEGYSFEGEGNIKMKVMGFSKESTMRESYQVTKNLALRSFEVEQSNHGVISNVSGKVTDTSLRIRNETNGKVREKLLRFKGDIFPGPVLNLYPLMRDLSVGKTFRLQTLDAEEVKVKEITITYLGEDKTSDGKAALKLRNTLYPFVNNDIWIDQLGNTLYESVRDGLVTTKVEDPAVLGAFVGNLAIARKDLIYDFSLVRAIPPIKDQKKLKGLVVEISGWTDSLPLLQDGGQVIEKAGVGRVIIRTASAVPAVVYSNITSAATKAANAAATATKAIPATPATTTPIPATPILPDTAKEKYLKSGNKIESEAPEIVAKSKEITSGKKNRLEMLQALASWTADWLKDTVDDGGGAVASLKNRFGNCQTHARLYTALARAAGIPTRFVSGLISLEGKGFVYHSWAESFLDGKWLAVDPTYNQIPADPTHLKLFEGDTPEEMSPLIALIGRIKIKVLETKYN